MQHANAIGHIAMSPAEPMMGTVRTRSELVSIKHCRDPHWLTGSGRLLCHWRATADGALRMQWLNPP
jgi:hypothetical protein